MYIRTAFADKIILLDSSPVANRENVHRILPQTCTGALCSYLAKRYEQASKLTLFFKLSKIDKVLRTIQNNIGEYEHLIRFVAGRSTALCFRVMGSILASSAISKQERYRILLDCSSEASDLSGSLSSIVSGCIEDGCMDLRSPTIYTAIGMKKLPKDIKQQVKYIFGRVSIIHQNNTGLALNMQYCFLHYLRRQSRSVCVVNHQRQVISLAWVM